MSAMRDFSGSASPSQLVTAHYSGTEHNLDITSVPIATTRASVAYKALLWRSKAGVEDQWPGPYCLASTSSLDI